MLYSWRFSRYSAPIHRLVHGHMISNNETVSRQMPWAGNIATGNSSLLPAKCWSLLHVISGGLMSSLESQRGFQILLFFVFVLFFCYIINHIMTGPLGNSEFCLPRISMFPSTSSRETLRFSGNKIHCSPRDHRGPTQAASLLVFLKYKEMYGRILKSLIS